MKSKKNNFYIIFTAILAISFFACNKDRCHDGIQNYGEFRIDCGGDCVAACPTCTDNIKNQGEEGIDCGFPCDACLTCSDGIKNQGESGIDCGGPCDSCPPTCNDNIQNQGETGIDCGGPCGQCLSALCDPKGNRFFPLQFNNEWHLDDYDLPVVKYNNFRVIDTVRFNGISYYSVLVDHSDRPKGFQEFYRIAANGDVFKYEPTYNLEYLFIPANPVVNQVICYYPPSFELRSRKVTAINQYVFGMECSYLDCIEIQSYEHNASLHTTYYYKKGIGLIGQKTKTDPDLYLREGILH